MSASRPSLVLLHRYGCHLCEQMLEGLQLLQRNWGFRLEIRDIDADEELRRRYHDKVPVVEGGGRELCRYRLDEEALRGYLNGP